MKRIIKTSKYRHSYLDNELFSRFIASINKLYNFIYIFKEMHAGI